MHPQTLADEELVRRFLSGDKSSMEILVERYRQKLFTYIYVCVKRRYLAEDLFQETLFRAVKSMQRGKYSENGKFYQYLVRIAHNLIVDHGRNSQKLRMVSRDDYEHDILNNRKYASGSYEHAQVQTEIYRDVRRLIDQLPATQKEVLIMRHFLGMSYKEISEETNVSVNTALGRMRYAIMNIRKMITDKSITMEYKAL